MEFTPELSVHRMATLVIQIVTSWPRHHICDAPVPSLLPPPCRELLGPHHPLSWLHLSLPPLWHSFLHPSVPSLACAPTQWAWTGNTPKLITDIGFLLGFCITVQIQKAQTGGWNLNYEPIGKQNQARSPGSQVLQKLKCTNSDLIEKQVLPTLQYNNHDTWKSTALSLLSLLLFTCVIVSYTQAGLQVLFLSRFRVY